MRDETARLVFAERERQPMKHLVRPQPYVFVLPHINRGLEEILISAAHGAVGPISADRQIAIAIRFDVSHVGMEPQINAEFAATLPQYAQEFQPANARKPVAANRDPLAFVNDVDVVPDFASADDLFKRRLIAFFEVRKGLVGKDYAPAECVVWPVTFDDDDPARWVLQLHQDGEIQSRRPASNHIYLPDSKHTKTIRYSQFARAFRLIKFAPAHERLA